MRRLGVLLLLAATAWAGDRAGFDKALDKARTLTKFRKWKRCKAHMQATLAEHEGENYVRARRDEITGIMKECAFRIEHGRIDPAKLVSGKLSSYSLKTGKIKIRYGTREMGDFVKRGPFMIHGAAFRGPHTITIKGHSYPARTGVQFLVCSGSSKSLRIACGLPSTGGRYMPAVVTMLGRGKDRVLAKTFSICAVGRPYTIRINIKTRSVAAYYGKTLLVKARKGKDHWGRFGVLSDSVRSVEISGFAEPAWLRGLIDKETQRLLAKFEKTYDPSDDLPAWLFEKASTDDQLVEPDLRIWPGELDPPTIAFINECLRLLRQDRCDAGLVHVDGAAKASAPTRHYWRGRFLRALGRYAEALEQMRKVCELDSGFVRAHEQTANLLARIGKTKDALAAYEELLAKYPGGARLHADGALFILRHGDAKRAKQVIDGAVARGVTSKYLRNMSRIMVKAVIGPDWSRKYEFKSRHYHVISDIDSKTCIEATRVLEESYAAYVVRLERAKDADKRRFRVYMFSGVSGYTKYCKDLLGAAMSHSAGLYDPTLKQLLIWNLPQREQMMMTVRHEGFHQYLDRIMEHPPRWFNEGLAEYYETAKVVAGKWRLGTRRPDHLRVLKKRIMPLRAFLHRDCRTFMAKAREHYAQSWAFIQFLRHSTKPNRELFRSFWKAFKNNANNGVAIQQALEGRDFHALEREFRQHVLAMAEG